jgi:hypothetical protein
MSDQEYINTYHLLHEVLNRVGLGWISLQVAEQVRSGRIIQKETETLREGSRSRNESQPVLFALDHHIAQFKKGPKDTFPVTVEYQPRERLAMLLNAIEHSVTDIAQMEEHLVQFFSDEVNNWDKLIFYDEDSAGERIQLEKERVSAHIESSLILKQLIDTLRELV